MPRQARLDSAGTLRHVMIRGIEKRRIVDDEREQKDFVLRLGRLAHETGISIYAWALIATTRKVWADARTASRGHIKELAPREHEGVTFQSGQRCVVCSSCLRSTAEFPNRPRCPIRLCCDGKRPSQERRRGADQVTRLSEKDFPGRLKTNSAI